MPFLSLGGAVGGKPSAHTPDVLDAIMAIDNELVDWILHAHPSDDDEKGQMKQVLALRTQIDQQVNKLVAARLRLATAGIEQQAARLGAITAQIQGTAKSIETVKDVIGAATEVIGIAAQVLAVVA